MSASPIVAAKDGKPGCPETRWDGPYRYRCGVGVDTCHMHGPFEVEAIPPPTPEQIRELGEVLPKLHADLGR